MYLGRNVEAFVAAREDLGHATGHLLPAIAVLVANVLRLPVKPSDDQKRIARLERQLESARARAGEGRKALAEVARLKAALDEARAELDEARAESARVRAACDGSCGCRRSGVVAVDRDDPAVRIVDAAVTAMLTRPPAGVDLAYVATFARRNRAALVGLVRARLDARIGGSP